jgi:hypothetical protein
MADGGAFAAVKAASIYALPQAAWFLVDIVRYQRRTRNPILSVSSGQRPMNHLS